MCASTLPRCLSVCLPVISAVGMRHSGVGLIADQPVEALVGEEADLLPVRAHHVVAACVEVAQQHDVLQRDCTGLTTPTPISYFTTKLSIFCVAVFVELKKAFTLAFQRVRTSATTSYRAFTSSTAESGEVCWGIRTKFFTAGKQRG